ncbi:MAG: cysteine desulfurase family protein [Pirellulaceae bacterium]
MSRPAIINLDHNATTPIDPRVADVLEACHRAAYANPSSQHQAGRRARRKLEDAREGLARLLGANVSDMHADRLVFTSGATEANNLALLGLAGSPPGRIIISSIEHPSVVGPAEELQRRGFELSRVRATSAGVVDVDHLRQLLARPSADAAAPPIRLVSVMLGNNETGVLQPISELAPLCDAANVPLHTDASQVVGKAAVDFAALGVAALSFTGHKFHGPGGIGALLLRAGVELRPQLFGGFQQQELRPGTEFVAPAIALQRALELWREEADERIARMTMLRDRFEMNLCGSLPGVSINGADAPRLPHTSNVAFKGLDRQALFMALDMAAVACSTGSACASGSSEPSPTLLAMGCDKAAIEGSLRFSLGAFTTTAEVDQAVERICLAANNLRNQNSPGNFAATSRQAGEKPL